MTDRNTVLIVTIGLALTVLACVGGIIYLTAINEAIPEPLSSIATTSLGALAALLVSTHVAPAQLPAQEPNVAMAETNVAPFPMETVPAKEIEA